MTTDSTQLPSRSFQRYLIVPSSFETCLRATEGAVMSYSPSSFLRRGLERFVMASKLTAPRCSQVKTCFARNFGSPMAANASCISASVMDLRSCFMRVSSAYR